MLFRSRRHPYSVILFDEIEKAHPEVFNIFLQILDEGHLTDGQGRTVSFKNSIIIMTSNVGAHLILEAPELNEKIKNQVEQELHKLFRPEFLNRIDAIVFFKRLSQEDVYQIADIMFKEIKTRMLDRGFEVTITKEALQEIAKIGYEPEFGARPLKRAFINSIVVPLARNMLETPEKKLIKIDWQNNQFLFV